MSRDLLNIITTNKWWNQDGGLGIVLFYELAKQNKTETLK